MDFLQITGRFAVLGLGLALSTQAHAGCSVEQTAVNEIVIKTSVGGCNTGALRSSLAGAFAGTLPGPAATAGTPANAMADVKRSGGQGALWRLANVHNQAGGTSLSMPGGR
jgi:hypothetical protein